jgi:hypothetical protein
MVIRTKYYIFNKHFPYTLSKSVLNKCFDFEQSFHSVTTKLHSKGKTQKWPNWRTIALYYTVQTKHSERSTLH